MSHRLQDTASPSSSPLDEIYLQRQYASLPLLGLLLALGLGLPLAIQADLRSGGQWHDTLPVYALIVAVQAGLLLSFGRFSVSLDATRLRWSFGWLGWPRGQVLLADIAHVAPARSRWTEGWGIRATRDGMLYNLRGLQAVQLTLRDGRTIRIGCSDPAALVNLLAPRLGDRPGTGR
ncbi:MAG TPA: hypothetical protein VLA61_06855 [Ideonella sp.]|uniref:hypothetical protein n=1 Tax=Ideonella sp. TaxID=1929293 RepID=UPI002CF8FBB5|nr:hypothetical protein [Ideonella sp.]HSI47970.1 hypothetical protein [Ideonella sp.]